MDSPWAPRSPAITEFAMITGSSEKLPDHVGHHGIDCEQAQASKRAKGQRLPMASDVREGRKPRRPTFHLLSTYSSLTFHFPLFHFQLPSLRHIWILENDHAPRTTNPT